MRILPILLLGACAVTAQAAELSNRDSRSYDLKIYNGGTTSTSISSNTTRSSICSECKLEIEGIGEVEVTSADNRIIIKGGQIERE